MLIWKAKSWLKLKSVGLKINYSMTWCFFHWINEFNSFVLLMYYKYESSWHSVNVLSFMRRHAEVQGQISEITGDSHSFRQHMISIRQAHTLPELTRFLFPLFRSRDFLTVHQKKWSQISRSVIILAPKTRPSAPPRSHSKSNTPYSAWCITTYKGMNTSIKTRTHKKKETQNLY